MRGDYDRRADRAAAFENANFGTQNLWITL
jgi:hypothetical protein